MIVPGAQAVQPLAAAEEYAPAVQLTHVEEAVAPTTQNTFLPCKKCNPLTRCSSCTCPRCMTRMTSILCSQRKHLHRNLHNRSFLHLLGRSHLNSWSTPTRRGSNTSRFHS